MRGDWTFGAYVVDQKADTAQRHIGCAIRLRHLQVRNAGGESIDILDAAYPHHVARYLHYLQWRLLDGLLSLLHRNHDLLNTVLACLRSQEHTSELHSLMPISYAFFFLQIKITHILNIYTI